jgi:hypothetical protein
VGEGGADLGPALLCFSVALVFFVAAAGNLRKVSLELGGKSPVVVMPDADMDRAIPGVAMATFFLQGQNCMQKPESSFTPQFTTNSWPVSSHSRKACV